MSTLSTQTMQVHSSVAYAPPRYVLFVRETTLMAQGFDADTLQLKADAFPVAEQTVRLHYRPRFDRTARFAGSESTRAGHHKAP